MSPAHNRSTVLEHFECSNVIEIHNGKNTISTRDCHKYWALGAPTKDPRLSSILVNASFILFFFHYKYYVKCNKLIWKLIKGRTLANDLIITTHNSWISHDGEVSQPHGPEEIEHLREGSLVRYRVGRGIHVERKILQGGREQGGRGREEEGQ